MNNNTIPTPQYKFSMKNFTQNVRKSNFPQKNGKIESKHFFYWYKTYTAGRTEVLYSIEG